MAAVFISYSKKNREYARRLADHLLSNGFDVWIDDRIDYGESWERVIFRAIDDCAAFIVIMTPESYDSDWVLRECAHAEYRKKPQFPMLLDGEVFPRYRPTQYVNLSDGDPPPDDFLKRLERFVPRSEQSGREVAPTQVAPPLSPQLRTPQISSAYDPEYQTYDPYAMPQRQATRRWLWLIPFGVIGALALMIALAIPLISNIFGAQSNQTDTPSAPTRTPRAVASLTPLPAATPTSEALQPTPTQFIPPTITPFPTSAAPTVAVIDECTIVVQAGDTFATIAQAYAITVNDLLAVNGISNPDLIMVGQELVIPGCKTDNGIELVDGSSVIAPAVLQSAQRGVQSNAAWTPHLQSFDGVVMALVPTGYFMMGTVGDDPIGDESPAHNQYIETPFWIDRTEVTRAQYQLCVDAGACMQTLTNQYSTRDNQPINHVTWFLARDYCEWRGVRLPTEVEWEYAARGPNNWIYPWGDEFVGDNVVYSENSGTVTGDVGSRPQGASWVGALDMSGNMWEWVSSLYSDYPYEGNHESNVDIDSSRVLRGGAFNFDSFFMRAAVRNWDLPLRDGFNIGFRCASDI